MGGFLDLVKGIGRPSKGLIKICQHLLEAVSEGRHSRLLVTNKVATLPVNSPG